MSQPARSSAFPNFTDGDVEIKLSHRDEDCYMIHSIVLSLYFDYFRAGLNPQWEQNKVTRTKNVGDRDVSVKTYGLEWDDNVRGFVLTPQTEQRKLTAHNQRSESYLNSVVAHQVLLKVAYLQTLEKPPRVLSGSIQLLATLCKFYGIRQDPAHALASQMLTWVSSNNPCVWLVLSTALQSVPLYQLSLWRAVEKLLMSREDERDRDEEEDEDENESESSPVGEGEDIRLADLDDGNWLLHTVYENANALRWHLSAIETELIAIEPLNLRISAATTRDVANRFWKWNVINLFVKEKHVETEIKKLWWLLNGCDFSYISRHEGGRYHQLRSLERLGNESERDYDMIEETIIRMYSCARLVIEPLFANKFAAELRGTYKNIICIDFSHHNYPWSSFAVPDVLITTAISRKRLFEKHRSTFTWGDNVRGMHCVSG